MKIAMVSRIVNDPLEAHRFYTEKLGFASRMLEPEARLAIVASPNDPDGTGLLLEPNDHSVSRAFQQGVYQLGMPVIVFGVEDVYREAERLKALGVVFRKEPAPAAYGGHEAIIEDGCGNLVQLYQA